MQEARTAPVPLCPLQAPQHEASRGPARSLQRSMLEEAAGFLPLAGNTLQLLGGILLKSLPSNGRAWGAVTALAQSLGKRPQSCSQPRAGAGSSRGTRAALGGSVPAVGQGQGATAPGTASPEPGSSSLSSWMSALAVIKIKSIFFCCKKRHCSGEHFPRVSSCVSVGWAGRSQRDPGAARNVWGFASSWEGIGFKFSNCFLISLLTGLFGSLVCSHPWSSRHLVQPCLW